MDPYRPIVPAHSQSDTDAMSPFLVAIAVVPWALLLAAAWLYVRSQNRADALASERDLVESQRVRLEGALRQMRERYARVVDVEEERERVLAEVRDLEQRRDRHAREFERERSERETAIAELDLRHGELMRTVHALEEEAEMQSFGYYEPKFDFASSELYKRRLEATRSSQKAMIKDGRAAVCHTTWEVGGSKQKGRRMMKNRIKLMLRAFNGECDAAVAKVRYNNVEVMEKRIMRSFEAINRASKTTDFEITRAYLDLKLAELHLAHEYHEKREEEREEQRRIREEMREEAQALKELERARREAEKEEARYEKALARAREEVARAAGAKQEKLRAEIEELERRLEEAHANKERAISRAQMTRSGHVYVISNVGSFGEEVYKIGMTRRLDPMDRVRELGDASVPFRFDVHAVIYSDDAPALENALHKAFHERRVNLVNPRKEFFRAPLTEIARVVREHHGEIEFTRVAEAEEYRKTVSLLRGKGDDLAPAQATYEYSMPLYIEAGRR